jgi:hypothetical protein
MGEKIVFSINGVRETVYIHMQKNEVEPNGCYGLDLVYPHQNSFWNLIVNVPI